MQPTTRHLNKDTASTRRLGSINCTKELNHTKQTQIRICVTNMDQLITSFLRSLLRMESLDRLQGQRIFLKRLTGVIWKLRLLQSIKLRVCSMTRKIIAFWQKRIFLEHLIWLIRGINLWQQMEIPKLIYLLHLIKDLKLDLQKIWAIHRTECLLELLESASIMLWDQIITIIFRLNPVYQGLANMELAVILSEN